MQITNKRQAYVLLLLMYVVSIFCRLPHLGRPLSKHHEFNPATVLIAVEAWQQRGGAAPFGYVPFLNYNNPGDSIKDKRWATDGKGNGIYLSYGPGMYVIPYWVFTGLHLPLTPLNLQCLNLLFLLVAVILLFRLLLFVFRQTKQVFALALTGCFLFLFTPCILWFCGNGYVNVTISLPFLIGAIHQSLIIFYGQKKSYTWNYIGLSLFIIGGIYIDWNAFFAAFVIAGFCLVKSVRQKKISLVALVAAGSAVLGILLILWQYTQYLPLHFIANYWKERFFTRSVENSGIGFFDKTGLLAVNFVWGYLPLFVLVILLIPGVAKQKLLAIPAPAKAYFILSGLTCLLYNVTFFNWSYIHDFSLVPISVFLIFIPVYLLYAVTFNRKVILLLSAYFFLSIVQYYYINRPGNYSQNGTPYALYKTLGEKLKGEVKGDEMIFMQSQSPIVNYYAKRFTFKASSMEEARQKLKEWNYPKGVWIGEKDFQLQHIRRITP